MELTVFVNIYFLKYKSASGLAGRTGHAAGMRSQWDRPRYAYIRYGINWHKLTKTRVDAKASKRRLYSSPMAAAWSRNSSLFGVTL